MQSEGLRFRFYPGDEAQLPDSLIEADQGAGNVPAFRGLCYMVFEHLPLAEYGSRLTRCSRTIPLSASTAVERPEQRVRRLSPPRILGQSRRILPLVSRR